MFKRCRCWRWAGLNGSQIVLGAIRIQGGAEGNLSKDGSAHSRSSAELCLCCCAGAGGDAIVELQGELQWSSVKPKRVPKIRQRGLVPVNVDVIL